MDKKRLQTLLKAGLYADLLEELTESISVREVPKIFGAREIYGYLQKESRRTKEVFISVFLDGAHNIIGHKVISEGLLNRTIVHPREVFREAILQNCAAVVVAHNHPSGNLEPSDEDTEITKRLSEAAKILGIHLLDHVIISRKGYFSFQEHSIMPK
jgi:DNA repair protein RadC